MSPNHLYDDEKNIQAFQQGAEQAYDHYFREYYSSLCFYANKYIKDAEEAKDIVQECFARVWERRESTRTDSIKSFLYTVVRNECLYRIRTSISTDKKTAQFNYVHAEISEAHDTEVIISSEMIASLYAAIEQLPAKMQQVFKLHYFEGKKYTDIAKLLNRSYDTVQEQKNRALVILKGKLLPVVLFLCYAFF